MQEKRRGCTVAASSKAGMCRRCPFTPPRCTPAAGISRRPPTCCCGIRCHRCTSDCVTVNWRRAGTDEERGRSSFCFYHKFMVVCLPVSRQLPFARCQAASPFVRAQKGQKSAFLVYVLDAGHPTKSGGRKPQDCGRERVCSMPRLAATCRTRRKAGNPFIKSAGWIVKACFAYFFTPEKGSGRGHLRD